MKILITNHSLESLGGTERAVIEIATALKLRGHEVVACSTQVGEAGRLIKEISIPVIRNPFETSFKPDVIHGQHHLDAMRALAAFPNTPAIYHAHGYFPWVEDVPVHPRITHYIGMSDLIIERLLINQKYTKAKYLTLSNWFDDTRFIKVRKPEKTPKKALLYLKSFNRSSQTAQQLVQVFKKNKIDLDINREGFITASPELLLNQYDIVLAAGKSAVEAIASGCAVLPISENNCLEWVNPHNFETLRRQNFSPFSYSPPFNFEQIDQWLKAYSASDTEWVTRKIRAENSLSQRAQALEQVYLESIEIHSQQNDLYSQKLEQELHAYANYLQNVMPLVREHGKLSLEKLELQHQLLSLNQQLQSLEKSYSMQITKPLRWLNQWRRQLFP